MLQEVDPRNEQVTVLPPRLESDVQEASTSSEQWRSEFPHRWDEDEMVTRRSTLRFLLAGSGVLCLTTGVLAVLSYLPSGPGVQTVAVAKVGELAENASKVFDFPDQYSRAILINLPGKGLVAYRDECTHLSCAVLYQGNGKLHCPCHEGLFDAATGAVLAGPPTRPLPLIQLAVHNGTIYAVKEVTQ
ncbi:MAG: Rieske 2Fe-2S domain-containing protein [Ktedonobacteraceae bacterium]|nr:Rieske 2Fe-2S domain-containing protein [Ktedonobacteraceae bacterium]